MTSHRSRPGLPGLTIPSPLHATSTSFTLPEVTVISPGLGRWKQQDILIQNDRIISIRNSSDEKNGTLCASRNSCFTGLGTSNACSRTRTS